MSERSISVNHGLPPVFALASGSGRAAIAVMRVSGTGCSLILQGMIGRLPLPRRASLRRIWRCAATKQDHLDDAVVIWTPGTTSYTGEDSFELHLHAGPAIISVVADTLVQAGARPAEAGEFTRRAFMHGRIDLTEAEGISDLIEAETEAQRKQALSQAEGALGLVYKGWSERLRTILAQQEALIDFPDEELPPEIETFFLAEIETLLREIDAHLVDGERGERIRQGLIFAIVGPPNAGKSTLLNFLAERDAAIVSPVAGTTRDAIEIVTIIAGVKLTLVDTAGLRETQDPIEAEGVRRAMFHVKQSDCVIQMFAADQPVADIMPQAIGVYNKTDLMPIPESLSHSGVIGVSLQTGDGIQPLRDRLEEKVRELTGKSGPPPLTRARHRAAAQTASACLRTALLSVWPEMRGEELRQALRAIGRLTGEVGVEDILDTIFGQFCIGK